MGIPGLLKEIGKGERVALAKLAVDHFERHQKPLRIAIDAAIWNFQTQSGQGGKNPALRTLFYRLLRLLALPIHPVFVYDGKNKPLTKRGKTVSRYGTCMPNEMSKHLVAHFRFPHHTAPGEAEAECALLQKSGIVDAVMSQDADAIMFGSSLTFRDWSKEGTKGNKAPTHVSVLEQSRIKEVSGLDAAGMILVALLSGGDYHEGVPGFGPGLSCQIAKAGFGEDLISLVESDDQQGLQEWRDRLQYELEENESGYFLKRHRTVKIPVDFPNRTILAYYTNPVVSTSEDVQKLEARWLQWWDRDIDVTVLRQYVAMTFDWLYKGGARKYIRSLAQPLFQHRLWTAKLTNGDFDFQQITERRQHFITGGIPELRFTVVPGTVVSIDLEAEEENPEFAELEEDEEAEEAHTATRYASADSVDEPSSPSKLKRRAPWDPSTAEKWWIPEALLDRGMPDIVKAWHQEQLDIRADPLRFATRKCKPAIKAKSVKKIDQSMKDGAIKQLSSKDGPSNTNAVPRSRKPLARAKTDTAIVQHVREPDIGDFFKPSKLTKATTNSITRSKTVYEEIVPTANSESDDGFDVDLLRLVHDSSKPKVPWLIGSRDDAADHDAAVSPLVTQRKKRTVRTQYVDEDDEVVCMGSQPRPPPISSFFGSGKNSRLRPDSTSDFSTSASHFCDRELAVDGKSSTIKPLICEQQARIDEHKSSSIVGPSTAVGERPIERITKKVAMLRESLPGTWKEMPLTPSRGAGIAFVDLTNT